MIRFSSNSALDVVGINKIHGNFNHLILAIQQATLLCVAEPHEPFVTFRVRV